MVKKQNLTKKISGATIILTLMAAAFFAGRQSLPLLKPQNLSLPSDNQANQTVNRDPALSPALLLPTSEAVVTKIIDGDTIVIQGGQHLRLLGIDADESGYPCYEPAKKRLEELILSKTVRLEANGQDKDQYGRLLRYVFLGDQNIGEELVAQGFAVARFYPDSEKYKAEITAAENTAIKNKIGCKWSGNSQPVLADQNNKTLSVNQDLKWQKLQGAAIDACEAKNHLGETVIVQGAVADVYKSSTNTTFLNFDKPYPDNCFAAVIFQSDLDKFSDAQNIYNGKIVRIQGKITQYQGKPEIILNNSAQIEVGTQN